MGLKGLVFFTLRASVLNAVWRAITQRRAVTILCFHDPKPDVFASHVRALKKHYTLIALADYLAWRQGTRAQLPTFPLVVTLDDGHRGNFQLLEVAEREAAPVTIFACSAIVGTNRHFWWKALVDEDERWRLKAMPEEERLAQLERRWGFRPQDEQPVRQALSDAEMRAMQGRWIDFQAHTRTHPILPRCDRAVARDEIVRSREELERRLAKPVDFFAYPNGDYSDRDLALVRDAGYACALTVDAGTNDQHTDLFRLKRIVMEDDVGIDELLVRASGLWDAIKRLLGHRPRFGLQAPCEA